MVKPKKLKPGSKIGIVSPSYWLDKDDLERSAKYFSDAGYRLKLGRSNHIQYGPFAGTAQERADDINEMFSNPEIDAIFCARGGYGANKVIPLINYENIRSNPKIFLGYSDITAYLTSISQKTELVTFHGPMLSSFRKEFVQYNYDSMVNMLESSSKVTISAPEDFSPRILRPGICKGKIWGGNLTLITNRLGSSDALKTDDVILFLEDVDEYLYSFERMLVHLHNAGVFKKINGLIIGELHEFKDQDIPFGKSTDEIIMDVCGHLDIPIITNFPCGHGKYQCTIPISVQVELHALKNKPYITTLESAVSDI
mgnify:FL=1